MLNNFSYFHKFLLLALLLLFIVLFLYFIFKFKKFNNYNRPIYAVLLFILAVYAFFKIKDDNDFTNLKENYGLTEGQIISYSIPKLKGAISSLGKSVDSKRIKYNYIVENKAYINSFVDNPYVDLPNKKPNFSLYYLVIFEIDNPENSYILLNYPITNELTFNEYKKLFSKGIPANTFKN